MKIRLEDYFTYHPPVTEERKRKHQDVNSAALNFAEVIFENVENEEFRKMIMFSIQQARMFANQAITVEEMENND